ncbi:MAG: lysophospholipase [Bacteroidia bacterium]|nr:lysophospholipase [Bacteroidia bacterium]MDW8235893.1 alpha/beta hydrolase [Bacteroidia bacterium]
MEFHAHTVTGHQGERLYTAWYPAPSPKGTVFWVHGYAEHSGRYQEVVEFLVKHGWANLIWDLRGHGRSTGRRGYITDLEEYLYDLTAVWTHWKSKLHKPVVLAGHSLGGLIVLRYRQKYKEVWMSQALIVSAPLLQLRLEVPTWKKALGEVAARLLPMLSLPSGLKPEQLSHDPKEVQAYAQDPLIFRTATAGWFSATQRAQKEAWKDLPLLAEGRYLFILPGADPICDTSAAQRFYERIPAPDKQALSYPDSFHEPLHETFRQQVFADILAFLQKI